MGLLQYALCRNHYFIEQIPKSTKGVLQVSARLLSVWFISHIQPWERYMCIQEIDSSTNPIEKYLKLQDKLPKYSFHEWANFIRTLTPDQFQWRIQWPKIVKAQITCQEGNLVPLLGLNGGTAYCPLRVVRQFGMI